MMHHTANNVPPENDAVYRKQLLEEARVCVKRLLSLCKGDTNVIDDDSGQVDMLCLILEKIFRHGLKGTNEPVTPPPQARHYNCHSHHQTTSSIDAST